VDSTRNLNNLVDADRSGNHMPNGPFPSAGISRFRDDYREPQHRAVVQSSFSYDNRLASGEYIWEIKGLSWLPPALEQEKRSCTSSSPFEIDLEDSDSSYRLCYSPRAVDLLHDDEEEYQIFDEDLRGTLVLIRKSAVYGTNIDVTFFVRDSEGEFVQWGDSIRKAWLAPDDDDPRCLVIGPDLEEDTKGIFGLSFEDLCCSQWVHNDSIAFKVMIKEITMTSQGHFRLDKREETIEEKEQAVNVPPSTLAEEMIAMLTEGHNSDVTIRVEPADGLPVIFAAHANILSLRSEVFRATLSHPMQESAASTIVVRDMPPVAMKALLYFLYADDFDQVERVLREEGSVEERSTERSTERHVERSRDGRKGGRGGGKLLVDQINQQVILSDVLAASHKYQVTRLLRWCEKRLCQQINLDTACSLLAFALLYGAEELLARCLKFMKAHQADVVVREDFASLSNDPLVAFHKHCAGVELSPLDISRKRKRAD